MVFGMGNGVLSYMYCVANFAFPFWERYFLGVSVGSDMISSSESRLAERRKASTQRSAAIRKWLSHSISVARFSKARTVTAANHLVSVVSLLSRKR